MSVRSTLLAGFRQILRIYFRKVHVAGDAPLANVRARFFLPNHVNGLVDPLLVLTTADCAISPIGKAPLWKIPVLGALLDAVGAVPVVRRRDDPTKAAGSNDELFDKVGAHVAGGGNLLIFPEGTSHNEPHLVKIRSGPSRMMLRASQLGASDVSFQAVGLEFEARDVFRSRALVLYGPVRRFADITRGALDDEAAVAQITALVERDLADLVVSGESWDERRLIVRVAEILAHDDEDEGSASIVKWSELARRIRDVARGLKDHASSVDLVDPVRAAVSEYYALLERDGLTDADVATPDAPLRRGRIGPLAMIAILPLAMMGFVLYALPYRVPRLVAARAHDADVVSTYKLATGIVVFPLWATVLTVLAALFLSGGAAATAIVVTWASPLPALLWLDAFEDGLLRRHATHARLRELRAAAVRAIDAARKELAPDTQVAS